MKGTIDTYDGKKGYGYIKSQQGDLVYLHVTGIIKSYIKDMHPGQLVEYVMVKGPTNFQAAKVKPAVSSTEIKKEETDES